MKIWSKKVNPSGNMAMEYRYRLDFAGRNQLPFLMLIREERKWGLRKRDNVDWASCLFQVRWFWFSRTFFPLDTVDRCPRCGSPTNHFDLEEPCKPPRNPIVHKKYFRTSREDRTVNRHYDPTCTVTWNIELGPTQRPWFHLRLNEFQFVFSLTFRYRGRTIFQKYQTQAWEPKNRKWLFNHWLFDQFEDRYQAYEQSLPEDPYGSISDWI